MKFKPLNAWLFVPVALLAWSQVAAEGHSRTVIGPRNVYLAEGAEALSAGDAEEGVRLSLRGLAMGGDEPMSGIKACRTFRFSLGPVENEPAG